MSQLPDPDQHRHADFPIEPLFTRRWSPRALSGAALSETEFLTVLEAGRWAPSTYNEQEWRFLYAHRDTDAWPLLFDLLLEPNKLWAKNAAVLVVVLARTTFARNGKSNPVHLYDAGAAWENIALQATAMGLVAHGMAGFEWEKARAALAIPEAYVIAAMFALGHPGDPDTLPEEMRKIESPSSRRPIRESICEGKFAFKE